MKTKDFLSKKIGPNVTENELTTLLRGSTFKDRLFRCNFLSEFCNLFDLIKKYHK
jgi:hypothetical protein